MFQAMFVLSNICILYFIHATAALNCLTLYNNSLCYEREAAYISLYVPLDCHNLSVCLSFSTRLNLLLIPNEEHSLNYIQVINYFLVDRKKAKESKKTANLHLTKNY